MKSNKIIGQERVLEVLARSVTNGQLAHAYLFSGEYGIGKEAVAIEFSRFINCENTAKRPCGECRSCKWMDRLVHPDISLIFPLPTGKNEEKGDDPLAVLSEDTIETIRKQIHLKSRDLYHKIDISRANFIKVNSIREIRKEAALARHGGSWKIFIILDADLMNVEASNSLLKTLEEPPDNTILILVTSKQDLLLPTIVSRCRVIDFDLLEESDIVENLIKREGVTQENASAAASIANGSYLRAKEILLSDMDTYRTEVVGFLRLALSTRRIELAKEIERLSTSFDKKEADRWIRTLELWLRSAFIRREFGGDKKSPIFDDAELERFNEKFSSANLQKAQLAAESSIGLLYKNAYIPLVFLNLARNLRDSIAAT